MNNFLKTDILMSKKFWNVKGLESYYNNVGYSQNTDVFSLELFQIDSICGLVGGHINYHQFYAYHETFGVFYFLFDVTEDSNVMEMKIGIRTDNYLDLERGRLYHKLWIKRENKYGIDIDLLNGINYNDDEIINDNLMKGVISLLNDHFDAEEVDIKKLHFYPMEGDIKTYYDENGDFFEGW
jgi:hypothetical protein